MSRRLYLRRQDKTEEIKNIEFPKNIEDLDPLKMEGITIDNCYNKERKEICLYVKEDCESFYHIAKNILKGIITDLAFSPRYEIVTNYNNSYPLEARIYGKEEIQLILDTCKTSTSFDHFINGTHNSQKERRSCVKTLLELYQFVLNENLEIVIH